MREREPEEGVERKRGKRGLRLAVAVIERKSRESWELEEEEKPR